MMQQDEHQALYRKWRPQNFSEVCGQEAITATLRQAVINQEISHAYLFAGTRGTGKTSLAKIFSRAINCLAPNDGNPCNQCNVCKAILDEQIMDVIEMDAASNNSVDNIRRLIEEVPFLPALAKYKVYIIDEVHMLSVSAFNALLKTLEEPPSHVVFILATTEPEKLPATILSRCQRYNFQRLANSEIANHLIDIANSLGLTIEKACLNLLVKLADGSMRDAISLLDQCRISANAESEIKLAQLEKLLGKSDEHFVICCLKAIQEQDVLTLTNLINDLALRGLDYSRFLEDLAFCYRQLLLVILSGVSNEHAFLGLEPNLLAELENLANFVTPAYCLLQIQALQSLLGNLRYSSQARLTLEVGLLALLATNCNSQVNLSAPKAAMNIPRKANAKSVPVPDKVTNSNMATVSNNVSSLNNVAAPNNTAVSNNATAHNNVAMSMKVPEPNNAAALKSAPKKLTEAELAPSLAAELEAQRAIDSVPTAEETPEKSPEKATEEVPISPSPAKSEQVATAEPLRTVEAVTMPQAVPTAATTATVPTPKTTPPAELFATPQLALAAETEATGELATTPDPIASPNSLSAPTLSPHLMATTELAPKEAANEQETDFSLDLHALSDKLVKALQADKQVALSFLVSLRPLEQDGKIIYLLFSEHEKDRMQITQSATCQQALQKALDIATNSKLYQLKIVTTDELGNIKQPNLQSSKQQCAEPEWLKKLRSYAEAEQISFSIAEKQAKTQSEW